MPTCPPFPVINNLSDITDTRCALPDWQPINIVSATPGSGLNRCNGEARSLPPSSPIKQLFQFLPTPLTFWDSFSRRGSAAARWPRQRRRWIWRTKFCFPANPCLTKGQCIPSFWKATEAPLGKIQFIVPFTPFLLGSRGERLLAFLWAIQGQRIPLFGPAAPSLPLLDVSSRIVRNGSLPR